MKTYNINVVRDGKWWMVEIPEIDGLTQARRISEIEDMARSFIAVDTNTPISEVAVKIAKVKVGDLGDVAPRARKIVAERTAAEAAAAAALEDLTALARALTEAQVPVRDSATLLDVSPQRVSQLSNA
ncbi:HicB family toxin-antitoxin system [Mycobacteroides abscessus]